jgi:hypothetical protein
MSLSGARDLENPVCSVTASACSLQLRDCSRVCLRVGTWKAAVAGAHEIHVHLVSEPRCETTRWLGWKIIPRSCTLYQPSQSHLFAMDSYLIDHRLSAHA